MEGKRKAGEVAVTGPPKKRQNVGPELKPKPSLKDSINNTNPNKKSK